MIKNGCGHSGHTNLKLAVSEEVIYGVNWYELRKAKIYVSFGVGVIQDGLVF